MDQDRQQRVQQRAHQIWEREGCPDGQSDRHWQQAEQEIAQGGSPQYNSESNDGDLSGDFGAGLDDSEAEPSSGASDDVRSARTSGRRVAGKQPG